MPLTMLVPQHYDCRNMNVIAKFGNWNDVEVELILLVPWLHILKHCYQQEFACKHTKILLVDILVPVFRPHFTVCNPLSNINI